MNDFVGGFIRHGIQAAGAALASKGIIEGGQVEQFVGIAMSLVAFAWSQYRKWKRSQEEQAK